MKFLRILIAGFCVLQISSLCGMNWLRPYDVLVRPELHWQKPWMLTCWTETGIRPALAFNSEDDKVNAPALWQCNQDALAMLNGFPSSSIIGQTEIEISAVDDGVRGHFCVDGDLRELFTTIFGAYYKFHGHFWAAAYLPVMGQKLSSVNWINQTQSNTPDDFRVQQYLTNNFFQNVCTLGNGLQLTDWKRVGLGDAVLMIEFLKHYPQRRDVLHDVMLNWCAGFNLPTGLRRDENKILAFPFGYDGAWGFIFGGGLRVNLVDVLNLGADVRLTQLFGNTRNRRIKTAFDQTDLLLLAQVPAYKDFGLFQLFSLYAQTFHVCRGLSLLLGYQFYKKGLDTLELATCEFSNAIANSATSLKEWAVHQVVLNATYDFGYDRPDFCAWPQASLFMRLPFNGRRSIAFSTIGAMISVEF